MKTKEYHEEVKKAEAYEKANKELKGNINNLITPEVILMGDGSQESQEQTN